MILFKVYVRSLTILPKMTFSLPFALWTKTKALAWFKVLVCCDTLLYLSLRPLFFQSSPCFPGNSSMGHLAFSRTHHALFSLNAFIYVMIIIFSILSSQLYLLTFTFLQNMAQSQMPSDLYGNLGLPTLFSFTVSLLS